MGAPKAALITKPYIFAGVAVLKRAVSSGDTTVLEQLHLGLAARPSRPTHLRTGALLASRCMEGMLPAPALLHRLRLELVLVLLAHT